MKTKIAASIFLCLGLAACAGISGGSYHPNALNTNPNIQDATAYCRSTVHDFLGMGGAWERCMNEQGWEKDGSASGGK